MSTDDGKRRGGSPTIFISAAEPSADLHAAGLIRAYRAVDPDARFAGIAGPLMRDAGCRGLYDMTAHAAMLAGAFKVVPRALAAIRLSKRYLVQNDVDLAVVVDSPTLHIPLTRHARRAGTPVLYYIAPQLWAWGEHRIRRLRARVDRLAVILPFEEDYFCKRGLRADYVGNPLFDELTARSIDEVLVDRLRARGTPLIVILPGSRRHVVQEVFAGQLDVARAIARRFDGAHFCVSVANDRVEPVIREQLAGFTPPHSLHHQQNGALFCAADLALIASGTATLEAAFYHIPMIVMYNTTRVGYHLIGRWFINCRYYSLVNILAGREAVPEFMPFYRSTQPIVARALRLLESPEELARMRRELAEVLDPLIKTGAAANTAAIMRQMITGEEKVSG